MPLLVLFPGGPWTNPVRSTNKGIRGSTIAREYKDDSFGEGLSKNGLNQGFKIPRLKGVDCNDDCSEFAKGVLSP